MHETDGHGRLRVAGSSLFPGSLPLMHPRKTAGKSGSYPGHGLWCAATGTGGYRAPRAAGSARRPLGEAAPDRKTTSLSLLSERSNPPLAVWRAGQNGAQAGEAGRPTDGVSTSCTQNIFSSSFIGPVQIYGMKIHSNYAQEKSRCSLYREPARFALPHKDKPHMVFLMINFWSKSVSLLLSHIQFNAAH